MIKQIAENGNCNEVKQESILHDLHRNGSNKVEMEEKNAREGDNTRDSFYQGSSQSYDVIVKLYVMVPARDGVGLMKDIYRLALEGQVVQYRF